jgi:acyl-CoA hydrolase
MTGRIDWRGGAVSPEEAVSRVNSGDRVFVHGAAATPTPLLEALAARTDLEGVQLYHLHLDGPIPFTDPSCDGRIWSNSFFTGPALRGPIAEGRADFMPVFLSDIPRLFESGRIPLDVAILQLTPPDKHGHASLGPSVDAALAAARHAKRVIAEVNVQMPYTTGNSVISFETVDAWALTNRPLPELPQRDETEVEARIGELVADLVDDGSCLQMGIGGIPDAALSRMHNKLGLGIHTEMFSDRVIDLVEGGVVTNRNKEVHRGRTVTSFVMGSQRLMDFVDANHSVEFYPCDRTNNTALIRKNPKVVAINSAIEIDLTGQVCADSMGHRIYSGIGGQMDFLRGAALSVGGKGIIALPSTAARGTVSRITHELKPGAGVVTSRGHVQWVVTEHGAVDLHGMTIRERGEALISIAHPDFRSELTSQLRNTKHFVVTV